MTLLAFAAERGPLQQIAIDSWYVAPAGRSAANQPHAAVAVDQRDKTDRRTDGRTDARPLHEPCSAHYADSINKPMIDQTSHQYSVLIIIST